VAFVAAKPTDRMTVANVMIQLLTFDMMASPCCASFADAPDRSLKSGDAVLLEDF